MGRDHNSGRIIAIHLACSRFTNPLSLTLVAVCLLNINNSLLLRLLKLSSRIYFFVFLLLCSHYLLI